MFFFFPGHFFRRPPPSWHQAFLTGYPCAPVCDLISYEMKGFCRKTGRSARRALQAPSAGRVPRVVRCLALQGAAADQKAQEPRAWAVTQQRARRRRRGKREEGSFRVHLAVSGGGGVKGALACSSWGGTRTRRQGLESVRQGVSAPGRWPLCVDGPCPSGRLNGAC